MLEAAAKTDKPATFDKIAALKALLAEGAFHHATHRNTSGLWNGLWIYRRDEAGFQGYLPAFCFYDGEPEQAAAHELVRHTGVSVGSYGNG